MFKYWELLPHPYLQTGWIILGGILLLSSISIPLLSIGRILFIHGLNTSSLSDVEKENNLKEYNEVFGTSSETDTHIEDTISVLIKWAILPLIVWIGMYAGEYLVKLFIDIVTGL
jgi:hypothetical protein